MYLLTFPATTAPRYTVAKWLKSWMEKDYAPTLTSEGWFYDYDGHLPGVHIWMPPPAAALIALKQLAQAKHKQPYTMTHIVLIPRLLYREEWQARFEKEMDVWFVRSAGSHWPCSAHEPLLVGLSFPLFSSFPWQLKLEFKKVVDIGRALSALSKTRHVQVRSYLHKLWQDLRALPKV